MQSKPTTAEEYLGSIPEDRKAVIIQLRNTILENLPEGFEEKVAYGLLCYVVPHSIYPKGYHCNPKLSLPFLSIASQKNYISLHHMGLYDGPLLECFQKQWPNYSSRKLDMGRCCIRFKKPEEIPFNLISELVQKMTVKDWISIYEKALSKT